MPYALFKNGKQVSKAHSSPKAAMVEAYEQKAVINEHADFPGDKTRRGALANGYEIKEISDDN